MRITRIVVASLSLLAACRSNNNNNSPDGGGGGGDGGSGSGSGGGSGFYTIEQIRSPSLPAGSLVNVQGVVVTALDGYGDSVGDMWIEDPAGGSNSGVHVYKGNLTQEGALSVGDIITITGAEKDEYVASTDTTGRFEIELEPASGGTMTITQTGTGTAPAPASIDLVQIGQLYDSSQGSSGGGASYNNAWSEWAGALVTASNVDVFSAPKVGSSGDVDRYYLKISADAEMDSNLTALSGSGADDSTGAPLDLAVDSCLGTVTGIVEYYYGWVILPRSSSDMTLGNACVFETALTPGFCTDGIDNDGNGFTDCADLGCEVGSGAWLGSAACPDSNGTCGCSTSYASTGGIVQTNSAASTANEVVYLHNVYVTAIGTSGYWVSDNSQSAPSAGLYVYSTPPASLAVGDEIASLQGLAETYAPGNGTTDGTVTEVELEDATAGSATTSTVAPYTASSVATAASTASTDYVNILAKISNVKVTAASKYQVTLADGSGNAIIMSDDADYGYLGLGPSGSGIGSGSASAIFAVGNCYDITGVIALDTDEAAVGSGSAATHPQVHTINPRGSADVTTGSCD